VSKTIARFTNATDNSVEYASKEAYVNSLVEGLTSERIPGDATNPYNYKDWSKRHINLTPSISYQQYLQYLNQWYNDNITSTTLVNKLKTDYINFLKELDIRFQISQSSEKGWTEELDFTNDLDIDEAIPIFAQKLKEICIYLINKRQSISRAKLKYNMAGSNNAIEKLFYEYLLKAFTQRQYVLNVPESTAWDTFPELSSVNKNFSISIEELYDNTSYFDHSPYLPVSTYFNITGSDNISYYEDTLGISQSSFDWLFGTGTNYLCAENPLMWTLMDTLCSYGVNNISALPISAFDIDTGTLIDNIRIDLSKKYLGESQYIISGGYYKLWQKEFNYPMATNNNWFYWPSGEILEESKIYPYTTIDPIHLSATDLIINGATGGYDYKSADKIFVTTTNGITGAWLRKKTYNTTTQSMSCFLIKDGITYLKFPFPGIGLSGNGLQWTGPQTSNLYENSVYLPEDLNESLQNAYWSNTNNISSIESIFIQDTNLIHCSAYATTGYDTADKIMVRITTNPDSVHDLTPNSLYTGEEKEFWLYKMLKTDIPIKSGQNYIYWPLGRYDAENTISYNISSNFCNTVYVSDLYIPYGRAGYGLFDSDIIYKLDSQNGNAVECAFLSGKPITNYQNTTYTTNTTGIIQSSLSILCIPGEPSTFIWTDPVSGINDINIKHIDHQIDCPYYKLEQENQLVSLYEERPAQGKQINYSQWKTCECGAVLYSPLGHKGSTFDEYEQFADVIFLDTGFKSGSGEYIFDFEAWRGSDNQPYTTSTDFAWYKLDLPWTPPLWGPYTNKNIQVGWGPGSWKNYNGTTDAFKLSAGYQYKYLRCKLKRDDVDLSNWPLPGLVIHHTYLKTSNYPTWHKALLKLDGTWETTNDVSNMVLYPSDYILYDHMENLWFCASSYSNQTVVSPTRSSYNGSPYTYWSDFNHALTGTSINLTWPIDYYYNGPAKKYSEISDGTVKWSIKIPGSSTYVEEPAGNRIKSYALTTVGTYYFAVTGYAAGVMQTFSNIPSIEAFSTPETYLSGSPTIETVYTPTPNFMLNQPLSGWNYTTSKPLSCGVGSTPFWADASNINDRTTKYKGTSKWGGGINLVENYLLMVQPPVANFNFTNNQYIEYTRKGPNSITWIEPLTFTVSSDSLDWCKLTLTDNVDSKLINQIDYIKVEMIASGTDVISDIILSPNFEKDEPVLVNYWATNPFTWTQNLSNISLGIPPTGGMWVDSVSGNLITASYPFANLTNRHFPTIATVPSIDNVYSEDDVGGYFTPRMLGVATYISKNNVITLDPLKDQVLNLENNSRARGISAVFQNSNEYISNIGLTTKTQSNPVKIESADPSWMKADVTEFYKAGNVVNASQYKNFVPYQTTYESKKYNNLGVRQQGDSYDPWKGSDDTEWADNINYPLDFRKLQPIDKWYQSYISLPVDKIVHQWKMDIYNNQYALYKEPLSSYYDKKIGYGDLWVRKENGIVGEAYRADPINKGMLNDFLNNYNSFVGPNSTHPYLFDYLTGNQIKNFEVWYDTMMIETPDYLVFGKLQVELSSGNIFCLGSDQHIIEISAVSGNGIFAGTWFNEEDNKIQICTVSLNPVYYVRGQGFSYPLSTESQSLFMDICAGSYVNNPEYPHSLNISFSANSMDLPISACEWDFGDGCISAVESPIEVFASGDTSLYLNVSSGPYTLTVNFSATSLEETCTAWAWDFGDGYTSNTETVTHAYTGYTESNVNISVGLTGIYSALSGFNDYYIVSGFNITILPYISSYNTTHLYNGYTETDLNLTVTLTGYTSGVASSPLISSFNLTVLPLLSGVTCYTIIPYIYELDLNKNTIFNKITPLIYDQIYAETSIMFMSAIRDPIFSFNNLTNIYNITFMGNCYYPNSGVGIGSLNISKAFEFDSFSLIRPKSI